MSQPIITTRKYDNTPHPRRDGVVTPPTFADLKYQMYLDGQHQRTLETMLRGDVVKAETPERASEIAEAADAFERRGMMYEALERMVEKCWNDPVINNRLKALKRMEDETNAR
jgi:hypothetical protein